MNKKGNFYQRVLNLIQYLEEENRRYEEAVEILERKKRKVQADIDQDEEENRKIDNFVLLLIIMASISAMFIGSNLFGEKEKAELEKEKSVKVENSVPKQEVFEGQYVLFPEKKLFAKEDFFKNINRKETSAITPVYKVMNNQKIRE